MGKTIYIYIIYFLNIVHTFPSIIILFLLLISFCSPKSRSSNLWKKKKQINCLNNKRKIKHLVIKSLVHPISEKINQPCCYKYIVALQSNSQCFPLSYLQVIVIHKSLRTGTVYLKDKQSLVWCHFSFFLTLTIHNTSFF